jgi:fibronectin type 3 domain-containing protein
MRSASASCNASGKTTSPRARSLLARAIRALWGNNTQTPRAHQRAEVFALEQRVFLSTTPAGLPLLDSNPGAKDKIYLDFLGTTSTTSWGSYSVPTTPAYDIDGNPAAFSAQETANMQEIWARVAEMYSPFNIDVTTIDPGVNTPGVDVKVVIGGTGSWLGASYGGYSYIGSFTTSRNTSWVFPANLGNGVPYATADCIAHEAGHEFGLQHQSVWTGTTLTAEYNHGNSYEAPIMGTAYYSTRGVWFNGTNDQGYNVYQDDMSILSNSTNGFGYRAQDHGQTMATANALTVDGSGNISAAGVISKLTDTDMFSFTTGAGTITLNGNVAQFGAMLDMKLVLLDSNGNVIASASSATQLSESITATVAAGKYYLEVVSYGNYGDVGQYTVSGTIIPPTAPLAAPTTLAATADAASGHVSLSWTNNAAGATSFDVQRSSDGGNTWLDLGQVSTTSFVDATGARGGSYQYRVNAISSTSTSTWSSAASTVIPPAAPSALSALGLSSSQISLTWTAGPGDVGFVVQRSSDGSNWATLANTPTTAFTDSGLTASTLYYYRVYATANATSSLNSNTANATTAAPPAVPSGLNASAVSDTQITLTWTAGLGDSGFVVQRSSDCVNWSAVANTATTTFTDSGLLGSTTYYYQVYATGNGLNSLASNVASATTAAPPIDPPAAPAGLVASADSDTQITLTWTAGQGDLGFVVQRSTDSVNWLSVANTASTTFADSGLSASTTYYYRLYATANAASSAYTDTASATTAALPVVPPGAPSGLAASAISNSQIALAWQAGLGDSSFVVQRSADGVTWTSIANATGTTFTDSGLSSSTTYYYQVYATGNGLTTASSNMASATTAAPPPPVVTVPVAPTGLATSAISHGKINFAWVDNSNNETSFVIQYSSNGKAWTQLANVAANTTSYSQGGFKKGTVYTFRIFASNSAGLSAASNTAIVTAAGQPLVIKPKKPAKVKKSKLVPDGSPVFHAHEVLHYERLFSKMLIK